MTATLPGRMLLLCMASLACAGFTPVTAGADPSPASVVELTIREERDGTTRKATLTCDPSGGSHPQAADVCAALIATQGDVSALQPQRTNCPMVLAPVHASAKGNWRGEPIRFAKDFSNSCVAAAETEGLFAF